MVTKQKKQKTKPPPQKQESAEKLPEPVQVNPAAANNAPVALAPRPIHSMAAIEIDSQIATAKQYPRNIALFKERMMAMANLDQETAESCYYALPRAGKPIDGPSIRLAEIALACYGNCVAQADVEGEDDKYVYAIGRCRDLENNNSIQIRAKRRIVNKEGKRYNDDMIAVTSMAVCAIALRNAILKIIPAAFIKPVFLKCKQTAVGSAKSLIQRRDEVIARLGKFGVDKKRILKAISCKSVDEVTFDDIAVLIGLGTAIKDGDTTVEEAFPPDFKTTQENAQQKIQDEAGSETVSEPQEQQPQAETAGQPEQPLFVQGQK